MPTGEVLGRSAAALLRERVRAAIAVHESLLKPETETALAEVADAVAGSLRSGGRVLLCGNGGSAADAQHLAAELIGRFHIEREPLAAVALADNVAALTAVGNDFGFEEVFARGVRGIGRAGDVVIGLSTSGRSLNVIRALEAGRDAGLVTVAFVGAPGSPLEDAADLVLRVDGDDTAQIQEAHMLLGHTAFEIVERELCAP